MDIKYEALSVTLSSSNDKVEQYRNMLILALHAGADRFPDSAVLVLPTLVDFLADSNQTSAVEAALFVRQLSESHQHLREQMVAKRSDAS